MMCILGRQIVNFVASVGINLFEKNFFWHFSKIKISNIKHLFYLFWGYLFLKLKQQTNNGMK